jgi:hypothetical protein
MHERPRRILHLFAAVVLACATSGFAADGGAIPVEQDPLKTARDHIGARRWSAAIEELRRVDDETSADWNNLMGYAMRKQKTPDLAASEKYYDAALRIDPHHRGTLEYSGELYLMKGDLPAAEGRLTTLETLCPRSCPEARDLKKAIDRYKAAGNRYEPVGY